MEWTQNDNYQWYVDHLDILNDLYKNKIILINDCKVDYAGDSFDEVMLWALKKGLKEGSFNIQSCVNENSPFEITSPLKVVTA